MSVARGRQHGRTVDVVRRAALLMLVAGVGCAPSPAPRTESGFLPPDLCAAIGWPGAMLGVVAVAAATLVALYWIYAHYEPGS